MTVFVRFGGSVRKLCCSLYGSGILRRYGLDYKNAKDLLPEDLLNAVQEYTDGTLLYIPQKKKRSAWGEKNGTRSEFKQRNTEIVREYRKGTTMQDLADKYCLSTETLRKIISKFEKIE